MPSISQEEISKYWEIFQQQNPSNGYLSGEQMIAVLQNSKLPNPDLEKVWDLSDIDGDGRMDFEEFCIAMRLVFDHLKQPQQPIPSQLPQWLVPASKQHLLDAKLALSGQPQLQPQLNASSDEEEPVLRTDFNWYISPQERREYESIYSLSSDSRGRIAYENLDDLYKTLRENVPDTDISSAWNLVNPKSEDKIDKEQCIVFLHMLNQRFKGVRLPRSVPASLRATFGKEMLNYDLSGSQADVKKPTPSQSSSTKSFTDGYMSKMGMGSRSQGPQGSESNDNIKTDNDWEEARLKRELQDLTERLDKIESAKKNSQRSANSGAVKRELQLLLEYKQRKLQNASSDSGPDLSNVRDEVMMISEQVDALKDHLKQREQQLSSIQQEISSL